MGRGEELQEGLPGKAWMRLGLSPAQLLIGKLGKEGGLRQRIPVRKGMR